MPFGQGLAAKGLHGKLSSRRSPLKSHFLYLNKVPFCDIRDDPQRPPVACFLLVKITKHTKESGWGLSQVCFDLGYGLGHCFGSSASYPDAVSHTPANSPSFTYLYLTAADYAELLARLGTV